jgi:hypothetical protein
MNDKDVWFCSNWSTDWIYKFNLSTIWWIWIVNFVTILINRGNWSIELLNDNGNNKVIEWIGQLNYG